MAEGSPKPNRLIGGQITRLTRGTHDIRYDPVHDEILLQAPHADALLVFRGGADGPEPPLRVIQGPKTQISACRVEVDPVNNEILIPAGDRVLVFSRTANGNVAPIRVIRGPDTQLRRSAALAVDPVHNLIIVGANVGTAANTRKDTDVKLLFFNRTDNGNVKPLGEILIPNVGPQRTSEELLGQMRALPSKELFAVAIPGADRSWEAGGDTPFIGIWSIHDRGRVPPRWKLGGSNSTLMRPRGLEVNPANKEIYVADMRQNALLTFYFPEIF